MKNHSTLFTQLGIGESGFHSALAQSSRDIVAHHRKLLWEQRDEIYTIASDVTVAAILVTPAGIARAAASKLALVLEAHGVDRESIDWVRRAAEDPGHVAVVVVDDAAISVAPLTRGGMLLGGMS